MRPLLFLAALALGLTAAPAQTIRTVDVGPLRSWLAQQREIRTLAADFTQTRRLRVLRDPVVRPGRLWFRAPGAFRWELGQPAETIVVRDGGPVEVIRVRAREVSRFDPAKLDATRDLPILEFPLAADYEAFRARFELLDLEATPERCTFAMLPRDAAAARALKEIRVRFDRGSGQLLSFVVTARDGSELRNDFSNVRVNEPLPADAFRVDLTGYTVRDEK